MGAPRFSPACVVLAAAVAWAAGCSGYVEDAGASGPARGGPFVGPGGSGSQVNPDFYGAGAASPLRRLSATEYRNTVRDLFASVALPVVELPTDERVSGFTGQSTNLMNDTDLEKYLAAAESIATAVAAAPGALFAGCDIAVQGQDACVEGLADVLVPLAYRRPLVAAERSGVLSFYREVKADRSGDDRVALEAFLTRMLMAPGFLYKVEYGTPAPELGEEVYRLSDFEIATRLSYALWKSTPDAELLEAARRGELQEGGGLSAQAQRLLGDPRAVEVVWDFHAQWLHLDHLAETTKSDALFPEFDGLRASMVGESRRLVEYVVYGDAATFSDLLAAPFSFVDDALADFYGLASHNGPGVATDLDPAGLRAGILGHAAFLSVHAKTTDTSVVHRGLIVQRGLLCTEFAPPPPGATTQNVADRVADAQCGNCHQFIDPIGRGLEKFDAIGRYREDIDGAPIDSTGMMSGSEFDRQPFDGPAELGALLASAEGVRSCYLRQWLRFVLGRNQQPRDGPDVAAIVAPFLTDGDVKELLVRFIDSTLFRTRVGYAMPICEEL